MDPHELLKATPELQRIVTTIVAGVPVAEIVKRIVLPSADALGERMKNRVERCFEKTGRMVQDAGFTPQPVSDKLSIQILQGASLEEDDTLHTMWAALLANAAAPGHSGIVRPALIALLRQMSNDEAAILNFAYDSSLSSSSAKWTEVVIDLDRMKAFYQASFDVASRDDNLSMGLFSCLDSLEAAQLVITTDFGRRWFRLTHRGFQFVLACRPPKPKS